MFDFDCLENRIVVLPLFCSANCLHNSQIYQEPRFVHHSFYITRLCINITPNLLCDYTCLRIFGDCYRDSWSCGAAPLSANNYLSHLLVDTTCHEVHFSIVLSCLFDLNHSNIMSDYDAKL